MTDRPEENTAKKRKKTDAVTETEKKPKTGAKKRARKNSPQEKPSEREIARASLEEVWSRKTALEGLKRIFETALEGARIEVRDEEGALREVKFNPSAANAATKAVETANRMLGYTTPDEEEEDAEDGFFTVELGDAEEFAL